MLRKIFRSSLCLLFTALFTSAVFAAPQQGRTDVQSLQYEFGTSARPSAPILQRPLVIAPNPYRACVPVRCCMPVRYCTPVYTAWSPCYSLCCYPAPAIHRCYPVKPRRTFVRPVYSSPYWW
jgi:hypothetical protein